MKHLGENEREYLNSIETMAEIVRIANDRDSLPYASLPFEIILEKPRELLLHREVMALIQEESERILKTTDYGKQFDSVAFSLYGISVQIDLLALWILENQSEVYDIRWSGKHHLPVVAPTDCHIDSVGSAIRTEGGEDLHRDEAQEVPLKQISRIQEVEECAKQLVDIYHARFCLVNQDDFEHANAILLKKASQGRTRTELEIMVFNECNEKIMREVRNLTKRSNACEAHLVKVTKHHRHNLLSYVLSPNSYKKWYEDVGAYIEKVAVTKIRHRTARHLSKEEKQAELRPLYPKGWFDPHVFHHLESIHPENVGSAPEDIKNMCGRNDRNIHTEMQERNLYNSHMVAKAHQRIENLEEQHKNDIHDLTLKINRECARHIMKFKKENNTLGKTLEESQQFHSCSLNNSQSGPTRTIQEIERPQRVLITQDPAKTMNLTTMREKENVKDAQKKGQVTATKRQQDTRHNPKEYENPYKRCYTNTRRR